MVGYDYMRILLRILKFFRLRFVRHTLSLLNDSTGKRM